MKKAVSKFSRTQPIDETVWDASPTGSTTCRAVRRRPSCTRRSASTSTSSPTSAARGQRALLPGDAADDLPDDRRAASARPGSGGEEDGTWRRVVIEKPFGRDLASASALNAGRARGLRREPGLPHRPLPGQGDGPEHPRPPLRQRHLRAGLEPQLRRPRADHGGRVDRRRGPRPLLRGGRRAARHRPEPPAAGALVRGHGAAGVVRGRGGARRAGQGAAVACGRCAPRDVVRGQYAAGFVEGERGAGVRRGGRRRAGLRDRDVRRGARLASTTGAGPTRRSTCAPASACRSA